MRKYLEEELLQIKEEKIKSYGIDIYQRTGPNAVMQGHLDKREFELLKEQTVHEGNGERPPMEILVRIMRDAMGFPNLSLNEEEIITKCQPLEFNQNKVEIWRYFKRRSRKEKRSAFIMIHGGGWVGGSVYVVENFCKYIAEKADAVVFNLTYSLAPEKPYPNGLMDCYEMVNYIAENAEDYGIDPQKIAIGGDSAGGNHAAAVCILAKERSGPRIASQILFYPCVVRANATTEGYRWDIKEYNIAKEEEETILKCLDLGRQVPFGTDITDTMVMRNEADIYDPLCSPMLYKDKSGLSPLLLFTMEFDGLRLQEEFFAAQLSRAGVPVKVIRYKGQRHALVDRFGHILQCEDMANEVIDAIKNM